MRGVCWGIRRIIPANTGRMPVVVDTCITPTGSSPRIRGELPPSDWRLMRCGIIPANTGRMQYHDSTLNQSWDHPREYGENPRNAFTSTSYPGSSPRIRGEYHGVACSGNGTGIIPANTGRIRHRRQLMWLVRDHPREYGENASTGLICGPVGGSSPRIRGELRGASLSVCWHGIIPANTGRID